MGIMDGLRRLQPTIHDLRELTAFVNFHWLNGNRRRCQRQVIEQHHPSLTSIEPELDGFKLREIER